MNKKFYALETQRLYLREVRPTDASAMFHMIHHNPKVLETFLTQYMENESEAHVDNLLTYQENGHLIYIIELKETGAAIGLLLEQTDENKTMELGYAIGEPYWNQGYTTEAMRAVIAYLFKKGYQKVTAQCFIENKASERVMIKSGMIKTETQYTLHYQDKDHLVIEYEISNQPGNQ
ncbi:MAG: GNAT family N-acetyltransferase [Erysipelotrichaceae bacterium]|nr:GNAT family N-acetyltransferase [Erysipelotrichaceae bacterium]